MIKYEHAQQDWNRITPKCKNDTLGDFHGVYLATDVLLLFYCFKTFRNTWLEYYKLDPVHFFTAPTIKRQVLAKAVKHKNSALWLSEFRLELITDTGIFLET